MTLCLTNGWTTHTHKRGDFRNAVAQRQLFLVPAVLMVVRGWCCVLWYPIRNKVNSVEPAPQMAGTRAWLSAADDAERPGDDLGAELAYRLAWSIGGDCVPCSGEPRKLDLCGHRLIIKNPLRSVPIWRSLPNQGSCGGRD